MSSIDADGKLQRKQQFYSGLDSALADSDEEPDTGREASAKTLKKASQKQYGTAQRTGSHLLPSLTSDTHLAAMKPPRRPSSPAVNDRPSVTKPKPPPALLKGSTFSGAPKEATVTERPPTTNPKLPPALLRGSTFAGAPSKTMAPKPPPSSAIPKASGKRKREVEIKRMPEAQQVFKGLHFYFFPNNDDNPARRMRIIKALEFGATWQREWNESVTHVVADKLIDYSLILRFLKVDALPEGPAVVTENYASECISFRAMLDPGQAQFRVEGHGRVEEEKAEAGVQVEAARLDRTKPPPLAHVDAARPVSADSNRSLQLKPAAKSVTARQPETPRATDEVASSQQTVESPAAHPQQPLQYIDRVPSTTHDPPPPHPETISEFEAAIAQARQLQNLPLEPDDEEPLSRPTSSGNVGPDTDDEAAPKPAFQLLKQRKSKYARMQDTFQCMQKHTGSKGKNDNPNAATIAILQQMAEYYGQMGDEWRIRAYRKAITTLRTCATKVWTKEEALALPQIGERLAVKIEEIAFTHRLRRLDNARAEPEDQVLRTFMQVYGAGFAKASEWVGRGYKSLDEVSEKAPDLTANQRIGIDHYEDFNTRIPRAEVEQHGSVVRAALQKLDASFEVIIGGSYRRGAKDSGDIDCMITRPNTGAAHLRAVVLEQLIPALTESNFIVAALAATNKDEGSKWHGASCLPAASSYWRRIDLLLVPSDEIGAALIYFTGNDIFNRSLRLLASTKGMRLNQRGLYKDVLRGQRREKLAEGTLVEGKCERRIFEVLGVPWRPAEHRIC
ncbi:hypothetical protein LTR08_006902 [Meristemomyces frigidus]|nr:hypothetical protein LTR08_006902 [Meristemomyces frigidus]